jgi:hypothetical protein
MADESATMGWDDTVEPPAPALDADLEDPALDTADDLEPEPLAPEPVIEPARPLVLDVDSVRAAVDVEEARRNLADQETKMQSLKPSELPLAEHRKAVLHAQLDDLEMRAPFAGKPDDAIREHVRDLELALEEIPHERAQIVKRYGEGSRHLEVFDLKRRGLIDEIARTETALQFRQIDREVEARARRDADTVVRARYAQEDAARVKAAERAPEHEKYALIGPTRKPIEMRPEYQARIDQALEAARGAYLPSDDQLSGLTSLTVDMDGNEIRATPAPGSLPTGEGFDPVTGTWVRADGAE